MFEYGDKEKTEKIHKEFKKEFNDLLVKYGVELEASDHWTGYAECGQDVRIVGEFEDWKIDDIDFGSNINITR